MAAKRRIGGVSAAVIANIAILSFVTAAFARPPGGCLPTGGDVFPLDHRHNPIAYVDPTVGRIPADEQSLTRDRLCDPAVTVTVRAKLIAYPNLASSSLPSGTVICAMVGTSGNVQRAYFPKTGDQEILNSKSLEDVRRNWRFTPAMDRSHPIGSWQRIIIGVGAA